jgi:flagellar hook-basal body complex protein FliE
MSLNISKADLLINTSDINKKISDSTEISKSNKINQTSKSFGEMLSESIKKVETFQKNADKLSMDLATGKSDNIAETMIAVSKAEIAFQLMTQLRNKAINAYNEIMKMQV